VKNKATIHMGASTWTVTVRGAEGQPVSFDLYRMDKDQRRTFRREFMKAYRAGSKATR
jgi:hypothetical protein